MRELDVAEQRLKQQMQLATEGLKGIEIARKALNGSITPTPAPAKPNGKHRGTVAPMTAAAKRKQSEATKAYWAKVKSGEIKRKGYKANA